MIRYKQFLLSMTTDNGLKLPVDPNTYQVCDAHDPSKWVSSHDAIEKAKKSDRYHVGFVLTDQDPFFCVDIDKCLVNGTWTDQAIALCKQFSGCYIEVSQSGAGLHLIGTTTKQIPHACKNIDEGLELYTSKRIMVLTGTHAQGNCNCDATLQFEALVERYFKPKTSIGLVAVPDQPRDDWVGPENDDVLLEKMMKAKDSARVKFGNAAGFTDLFEGRIEVLSRVWPDEDRAYDASSADAALAQHLAFWTGCNGTRMINIMKRSQLVRDKWNRDDYLDRTVLKACNMQGDVYKDPRQQGCVPEPVHKAEVTMRTGYQILTINQVAEYFKQCVYVTNLNKVLIPNGKLLDQSQFKALYGGYKFAVVSDNAEDTKNAWEAFVENRGVSFPKVGATTFRPDLPYQSIVNEDGVSMVNTYVPVKVPSKQGDPSRFLELLEKLLPNERDRKIMMSYMAACVQHKGKKFQWAPLLQGIEGNGKTMLTQCVVRAVGRIYSHLPQASDISNKFNAWVANKVFIGVEDIYVPDHKLEVMEVLKPMITGHSGGVQPKGKDQYTVYDICCNFILNSNHKDAIRKTLNDRRFCILYTAQQKPEDMVRDGMTGNYFPELYEWMYAEGYAIVTNLLQNMEIPDEFNPATKCHRAPITTSTDEAVTESMGGVEQEIEAAIGDERCGFARGWVSSLALGVLLVEIGAARKIPQRKRKGLLESLGYMPHPDLVKGRVDNRVEIDNGKPILYVKPGHHSMGMGRKEIAKLYANDQIEANR